jgi:hypothetical protein
MIPQLQLKKAKVAVVAKAAVKLPVVQEVINQQAAQETINHLHAAAAQKQVQKKIRAVQAAANHHKTQTSYVTAAIVIPVLVEEVEVEIRTMMIMKVIIPAAVEIPEATNMATMITTQVRATEVAPQVEAA